MQCQAYFAVCFLILNYRSIQVKFTKDGSLHAVEFEEMKGEGGVLLTSSNDIYTGMNVQASYGAKHYMAVVEASGGV